MHDAKFMHPVVLHMSPICINFISMYIYNFFLDSLPSFVVTVYKYKCKAGASTKELNLKNQRN